MSVPSSSLAFLFGCVFAVPAAAQSTTLVNPASQGGAPDGISEYPSVSGDGRFVAFKSDASNLVANDNNSRADVFVRDMTSSLIVRVSVDPAGGNSNEISTLPQISRDGRFVAFESDASNLVAGDGNASRDVFVRDLLLNTTVRASVGNAGAEGNSSSFLGSISADGRYVAFTSYSNNLVAGDTNGQVDVFLRDLQAGQTTRVSLSNTGAQSNNYSDGGSASDDGRYVAFYSWGSNLVTGDTNNRSDVFVRDLSTGTTVRASVGALGAQANDGSTGSRLSADGHFVVFDSYATNLVPGDTNGLVDLFERDLSTGAIQRVNVDGSGGQFTGQLGVVACHLSGVSADGRFTAFFSGYAGFVAGDTNGDSDVFVHDRVSGATARVSLGAGQTQANDHSNEACISADGRFVAFGSYATNLDPADTSTIQDVFLRDRGAANATAFCFGDGTQATPCPCANSGLPGHGCDNSALSGGALLTLSAFADPDSALLGASGLGSGSLAIFLQGDAQLGPALPWGDGLRCAGGSLKRLYAKSPAGGAASAPQPGDATLGSRSAFLGDPLAPGASRIYQVWYRDPVAGFCAAPAGDLWNSSNGVRVDW